MSIPNTKRIPSKLFVSVLFSASVIFAQSPQIETSAVEEWVQTVTVPNTPADIRIAISGSYWLFIEIHSSGNEVQIFSTILKETDLSKIAHSQLNPLTSPKNNIRRFLKSIEQIKTPLVPKFKYSNDLTEIYFASRSMMGSTLLYHGYIRDLPELKSLIHTLFPKTRFPSVLPPNK